MDTTHLTISIAADLDLVAREISTDRILELLVHAPESPSEIRRHPLNLGLVLDRSGSMGGEKLNFVKDAATHVLDLLDERDQVALVVFDNNVELLSPSCQITPKNQEALKRLIYRVKSGNTTNLSGGWLEGCEQVAQAAQDNSLNHTLLLTDGLANEGITDPEILAQHALELSIRKVTTSTFGVGRDYNHNLLESMANQGGGNYYFIETADDIPGIFSREFQELAKVTARDAEIVIELPSDMRVDVLGDWRVERAGKQVRINLGNLHSRQQRKVYIEMQFPPAGGKVDQLVKALVRGKEESGEIFEAETTLAFRCTSKQEMDAAERNTAVLEGHAQVKLARITKEALIMESEGRRKEASDSMNRSIQDFAPFMAPHQVDEFRHMSERMSRGMDEIDRKQSHYRRYLDSKQREEWRKYHLVQHDNHLIINADRRKILIDTGSPVSTGQEAEWYFLGHRYILSPEYQGITPHHLSGLLGVRVDILLGMDILRRHFLQVDAHQNTMEFSTNPRTMAGTCLPVQYINGIPTIKCQAGSAEIDVFVDTGAKQTLLVSNLVNGYPQVGKTRGFHPAVGEFETAIFEIPFNLAGQRLSLRCGVLPVQLEKTLLLGGVKGILGTEIFDRFLVEFAFPQEQVYFQSC